MANSLIELYGGGMAGKSNNYQLGGRIAGAKRRREYQGEKREIIKKQEEANRRKKKASFWGDIGQFTLGTLGQMTGIPGLREFGAAAGKYIGESTYDESDFGGGKYAQQTRQDLNVAEKDFSRGKGERALVAGLSAAVMPDVYEGLGEGAQSLGKGVKKFASDPKGFTKAMFGKAQLPELAIPELATADSVLPFSSEAASAVSPTPPVDLSAYTGTAAQNLDLAREMGLDLSGGQTVRGAYESMTGNPWSTAGDMYSSYFPATDTPTQFAGFRGGGLIGMTMPRYENGGMVGGQFYKDPRGEAVNPYPPTTQPPTTQPQNPYVPPTPIPAPYTPGYGTATDTTGALRQMGMAGVALDPRLQQYMGDLPDFQMGYAQQIGDIFTGARQAARGMRGQESIAAGQRGFSGSGIGQRDTQQAFGDLRTDVARQRRGVVEGYQADLLSAIGDIEQKGEFEFGTSPEAMGARVKDVVNRMQNTLAQQGITPPQAPQPTVPSTPEEQEMSDYYDRMYG